ncbi:hypothetical protein GCM10020001_049320 [Nonomuraea salmonea]
MQGGVALRDQLGQLFARRHVPPADRLARRGRQTLPVGGEGHGAHAAQVAGQRPEVLARLGGPQAGGAVAARARQQPAVAAERQLAEGVGVSRHALDGSAGARVEEAGVPVARGGDAVAGGGEGDRPGVGPGVVQGAELPSRPRVPQADAVARRGGEQVAAGAERHVVHGVLLPGEDEGGGRRGGQRDQRAAEQDGDPDDGG